MGRFKKHNPGCNCCLCRLCVPCPEFEGPTFGIKLEVSGLRRRENYWDCNCALFNGTFWVPWDETPPIPEWCEGCFGSLYKAFAINCHVYYAWCISSIDFDVRSWKLTVQIVNTGGPFWTSSQTWFYFKDFTNETNCCLFENESLEFLSYTPTIRPEVDRICDNEGDDVSSPGISIIASAWSGEEEVEEEEDVI